MENNTCVKDYFAVGCGAWTSNRLKMNAGNWQSDISELVNSFQRRTETVVQSVSLSHLLADAGEFPVRTQVTVRIELENN
jgi:hypothetical protein